MRPSSLMRFYGTDQGHVNRVLFAFTSASHSRADRLRVMLLLLLRHGYRRIPGTGVVDRGLRAERGVRF